jgi:hypothetical protein
MSGQRPGPRPGGPSDDSPVRERWVPSPMNTQPRQGRQNPFAHERQSAIASPSLSNAPEHKPDKPQSLEAAKVSVVADLESRSLYRFEIRPVSFSQRRLRRTTGPRHQYPPFLPETHFHTETPSPPRLEYPPSRHSWVRAEALLKRETLAQESGKKVAAIQRLLPAMVQLTVQFIRTIRNGIVLRMRCLAALAPLRISMTAYL